MRFTQGMLIFTMLIAAAPQAWAGGSRRTSPREAFFIGVCAGQAIAAQGLTVAMPEKGQRFDLDSPTEAALEEAFATCKAQANAGTAAAPTDGTAPTNAAPTAAPAPSPAPAPAPGTSG